MMRDIDKNPYTPDEARVATFFAERGIGGGDDPIGAIMVSHAYLAAVRRNFARFLAPLYLKDDCGIARQCDKEIDPCGTLLGLVREEAKKLANYHKAKEAVMSDYSDHMTRLMKAKRELESAANSAEEDGYQVTLQFEKDMMEERHKGKPHRISITLAREVPSF